MYIKVKQLIILNQGIFIIKTQIIENDLNMYI